MEHIFWMIIGAAFTIVIALIFIIVKCVLTELISNLIHKKTLYLREMHTEEIDKLYCKVLRLEKAIAAEQGKKAKK